MELITAIIQPFMLERVTRLLRKQKISGYTVSQVSGSGPLAEDPDYMQPHVKVEIAVSSEQLEAICDQLYQAVSTHQDGDGILYVTPITQILNFRTGLRGARALSE